ncbi:ABC transporter substrate-binding protein [Halobaculum sp. P14]|uniref:ABC transporter substrate-binding protein n=1 Tax=Halobaculum sp. P14 TaxID=3421638 RepID=UPI003EBB91BD
MRRRDFIGIGAGALTAGLAGCTDSAGQNSSPTAEDTPTDSADDTPTATPEDTSYSVSIEPMGEVTFEDVPQTWAANNGSWADMGVALGLDAPKGVWLPSRYHTQYYDEIPGVSVDASSIKKLWGSGGVSKESFLAMDADVHVMDPNFLLNRGSWEQSDVDQIESEVGPFFGNSIFSRSYGWHEDYRYYTLYQAFEKLAQVFQRTDRFEAFEQLHADFQAKLAPVVPPRSERPAAAVFWGSGDKPEKFYPYVMSGGTSFKQWRDLKVKDALANSDVKDFHASRGAIDFETMLEIDPEVILMRGQEAKTAEEFQNTVVAFMKQHDVASKLTAVQNGDVYRGGPLYQGPISNLVLTERAASQVYGVDEQLFDRQRVADIVAGDI